MLREYDVELSPQVQLILEKFKFNSVRTISMINLEKLELLELDLRSLFASDEELLKMTHDPVHQYPRVKEIMSDFEAAVWVSLKKVMPNVVVKGCGFHITQGMFKNLKKIG